MSRFLVSLLIGACALSTAYAVGRLIAPFYGFGPLLVSASLAVSFLALAIGMLLGSLGAASRARTGATALLLAAALTIVVPWLKTPLLSALEHFGLRVATIVAVKLFIGVPLAALGFALARTLREPDDSPSRRTSVMPIAAALLGAALAAPIVLWQMVPLLGVSRTLFAIAILEAIAAWLARSGGAARSAIRPTMLIAIAVFSAGRFPAVMRDPAHGLVDAREGRSVQYRVLDREDGRFLLADGGIQAMVSSESGEALLRPAAALQVIDLFYTRPESTLVLGLRGGAIAKRFARAGWRVSVIEPDPLAVRIASTQLAFNPREIPVDVSDVRSYCAHASARYPVVVFDALEQSAAPFHLITRECFETVANRVSENGILAVVTLTHGWNDPLVRSLAAALHARFRTVIALPTAEPPDAVGSLVLLASNRSLELPDERLPQPTDYFLNLEEHWNVVQMNHAWFNRFVPPIEGAVIITDDRNPIDLWSDPVENASRIELHKSFAKPPKSW